MNISKNWIKKIFYKGSPASKAVGVIAIFYGVIGLILPFQPGIIFIFIGLGLLGVRLTFWDKLKKHLGI